jgi:26S proteasome regulatory subunit N7
LKLYIDEAKRLNEVGGDWDRRNRLKIYEAHYLLSVREVKEAAKLLLDCVATFTCTELCTYNQFIYYTLLTNVINLDRNTLRKKVFPPSHLCCCFLIVF